MTWGEVGQEMKRYADLVITVRPEATDAAGAPLVREAACHYAYDPDEDEFNTSSDPMAAYSTNPHRVNLDGQAITGRPLADAVHAAMARQGRDWLARLSAALGRLFGGG